MTHTGIRASGDNWLPQSIKKGFQILLFWLHWRKYRGIFFLILHSWNMLMRTNLFPIGAGQTISQPYTVAFQTSLLKINKGDKILEIGTGSGYQACILAELGGKSVQYRTSENLIRPRQKNFFPRSGIRISIILR